MAAKKIPTNLSKGRILEATVVLNPRGRSVVNGTILLQDRGMTTLKFEIPASSKEDLERAILQMARIEYLDELEKLGE